MQWFTPCKAALLAGGLLLAGCASQPAMIAPQPPAQYERLGPAEGTGCGSLGIFGPFSNLFPMGLNTRVERAYQDALDSVPGATGLVDVRVREYWYWWWIATARCVQIKGEAIR